MKQIKLGIIGCGGMIAKTHMQNIIDGKCPSVSITAISNRTYAKAVAVAEMLEKEGVKAKVYETDSDLIQNADIDAVLINTPHYQHEALTVEAFEKGLHVLCEKPSGAYTLQARAMNVAADKAGTVFGMMFHHRSNPANLKLHELIHGGAIGNIRRINWITTDTFRAQSYYDAIEWRGTWKTDGGGVLYNQAPHHLDLFQWFFGLPTKITAFMGIGKWHDIEVEDDVTAVMEFPNGASGVFIASTGDAPGSDRLEVSGDYGKLIYENKKITLYRLNQNLNEFCQSEPDGFKKPTYTVEEILVEGKDTAHAGVLESFALAILEGSALVADGRDGYNSLALANAMVLSHWKGETITFPFDEEDYFKRLKEHYEKDF